MGETLVGVEPLIQEHHLHNGGLSEGNTHKVKNERMFFSYCKHVTHRIKIFVLYVFNIIIRDNNFFLLLVEKNI